jgi:murein DD-endopeptidase MepM/ murein hydrolase activator NlpD
VTNPLPGYVVSTPYGVPGRWMAGYHTGDDYSTHGATLVPVYAARGGTVVSETGTWGAAYGVHLIVEGRRRRIRVGYCHLDHTVVELGSWVSAGQLIAYSGNTGRTTGPHLHYEERRAPFFYRDNRRPRFNHRGAQ